MPRFIYFTMSCRPAPLLKDAVLSRSKSCQLYLECIHILRRIYHDCKYRFHLRFIYRIAIIFYHPPAVTMLQASTRWFQRVQFAVSWRTARRYRRVAIRGTWPPSCYGFFTKGIYERHLLKWIIRWKFLRTESCYRTAATSTNFSGRKKLP